MRAVIFCLIGVFAFKLSAAIPQPSDSQQIIITSFNNGDTLRAGQTALIQWVCIDNIVSVDIRLSPDLGKTWILLNGTSIGYMDTGSWGHYKWVVREKIKANSPDTTTFNLVGNHTCLFRVENYSPQSKSEISVCAKPLTILAGNGIIAPGPGATGHSAFRINAISLPGALLGGSRTDMRFFDARGKAFAFNHCTASGLVFGVFSNEAATIRGGRKAVYLR